LWTTSARAISKKPPPGKSEEQARFAPLQNKQQQEWVYGCMCVGVWRWKWMREQQVERADNGSKVGRANKDSACKATQP